ncbi:F-box associated interaction domain [Arabidopsis suecica]|uniref:F-box associated interaction domain n=1 Tax=Arabidopsis suecica TaxID=45249 RepID=A0A8T2AMR1_ARASU|nr:F-box associated interaction domain [Arabidopsis suecica]
MSRTHPDVDPVLKIPCSRSVRQTNKREMRHNRCFIFSAPEHDKSSTVVARHDMTISNLGYNKRYDAYPYYITCPPVNGLICCTRGSSIAVCNPTTRQLLILPDVRANGRVTHAWLGYDPVEDEYKVLCVMMMLDGHERGRRGIKLEQEHVVSRLSSRRPVYWRRIETPTGESYTDVEGGICINGAIYYGVGHNTIARFDLRYEKMMFIQAPKDDDITSWNFINHQGKFGGIEYDYLYDEMRVWIQEKEELWNNMTCSVPCEWGDLFREKIPSCPGEIHTGEVMLVSPRLESSKPFSVFYCDVIQESCRSAQVKGIADFGFRRIHGIRKHDRDIFCFPGYIENIMCLSRLH